MLPNNQVGFYVIAKDCEGNVRIVRFHESLDALVRVEQYLYSGHDGHRQLFSESLDDRVPYHWDKYYYVRESYLDVHGDSQATQGAYVVIDHHEQVVPLCELNRVANLVRGRYRPYYYRRSGRHYAWGTWRHVKTLQEKRAYADTLDQEVRIKVRGSRMPNALPDTWDDITSYNDKCWKTQSKRRHQWRDQV